MLDPNRKSIKRPAVEPCLPNAISNQSAVCRQTADKDLDGLLHATRVIGAKTQGMALAHSIARRTCSLASMIHVIEASHLVEVHRGVLVQQCSTRQRVG